MSLEKYGWFRFLAFPKCSNELFEGKSDDLVVQVKYVFATRDERLEGDSSDAYSNMSCSSWDVLVMQMYRELGKTCMDECCGGLRKILDAVMVVA
jgi:hypothetical protein